MDLADKDQKAALEFLLNWKDGMNEISAVSGGGMEGFAGPIGKKRKKNTTYR